MQRPRHHGILGEGIQAPSVTGSQDLGSELGMLWVARHLEKNWQVPSLWPAFKACQRLIKIMQADFGELANSDE